MCTNSFPFRLKRICLVSDNKHYQRLSGRGRHGATSYDVRRVRAETIRRPVAHRAKHQRRGPFQVYPGLRVRLRRCINRVVSQIR